MPVVSPHPAGQVIDDDPLSSNRLVQVFRTVTTFHRRIDGRQQKIGNTFDG